MKSFSGIALAICTVLCAIGGWFVYSKMYGSYPVNGTNGLLKILPILLAISGVVSASIGARGYMQAKSAKSLTPLVLSLNLVLGALAVLMALFLLLP
jgi:hypothetical protein